METHPAGPGPSRAQWLRRLASRKRDRVAFVLSGGGPLGALQVGALKALYEHGIRPDLMVGTSVGALNASFLALNPTLEGIEQLERDWRAMSENDLFPGGRFRATWARMFVRGNKLFESSGLRRKAELNLGKDTQIEDAALPLGIVATELDTGAERLFTSGPMVDAVLASSAMPGVYPPVEIDGKLYTDGGVVNNVPIAPALAMGATTLYVLNSTSHTNQRRPLTRPMDYFFHAFTLARSQRLVTDLRLYSDKANLVMIPAPPLDFFVPFASMDHTDRLIDMAYRHTRKFLAGQLLPVTPSSTVEVEVAGPAK